MFRTHGFTIATCATVTAATMGLLVSPVLGGVSSADMGGDQSPQQLAAQAQGALRKATSVRIRYEDRSSTAMNSLTLPTEMNLALDRRGDCAGTLTLGTRGGTVQIIKRGTDVWLKPDTTFWTAELPGGRGAAAAETFRNHYIHGSASDKLFSGIVNVCNLKDLQSAATATPPASLKEGLATMVGGRRVVPLSFEMNGLTSTLYVTTGTPHRLYRAAQKGPGTNLTLTFTDYNVPVSPRIPPASASMDVSRLQDLLRPA
ncbi:hypothetical protein [Streptomyces glomeratus]|uniref:Lipoprotein n=1 Tax=Streptomyces glomeratus TaxID=284452 RepID=A0ABP6L6P5_9ACTN|nr:hypothetical protein [Streptomyces glomeratus]MCF1507293.1 hypothetical protein [Streptomyces glomeratus]